MAAPKAGEIVDGFAFQGGDPSDQKNWLQVGTEMDGHTFQGGLASDEKNWVPKQSLKDQLISAATNPLNWAMPGLGTEIGKALPSVEEKARKAAGLALSYPSNLANTGLALTASMAKTLAGQNKKPGQTYWQSLGNTPVVTEEEAKNALIPGSPPPPSLKEYAERLNIPKGFSTTKYLPAQSSYLPQQGGVLDTNLRDASLAVLSALADPLNKFLPAKAQPASRAAENLGNYTYRSGFKIPDYIARQEGATPLSEFFVKEKPILNPYSMAVESQKLGREGVNKMKSAISKVMEMTPSSPEVSTSEVLGPALDKAQQIAEESFTNKGTGKTLTNQILNAWPYGETIPLDQARNMSIMAGREANWAGRAAELPKAEVMQQARHGAENAVVGKLGQLSPELQNQYLTGKQASRTAIVTEPYLKKEIGKAVRKNNLTEVKGALIGHGLENLEKPSGFWPVLSMYASKLWNTPTGRTATGKALQKLSDSGALDALLRQELVKSQLSPWQQIQQQYPINPEEENQ